MIWGYQQLLFLSLSLKHVQSNACKVEQTILDSEKNIKEMSLEINPPFQNQAEKLPAVAVKS